VSASNDTVVVGAYQESSIATGVNGDQYNDYALNAGAAYVFVRSGASWSQQAYLKASNTEKFDVFGTSVAVSVDTVVVGTWRESSNATGVNGDQRNNNALASGAAYVFVRIGTSWSQQAYLKASNTEQNDYFGYSVSASEGTIVVGARGEDSSATGIDGDQGDNSAEASGAAYVFEGPKSPWADLGHALAGGGGLPNLLGTGELLPGMPVSIALFGAHPSADCVLVLGVSNLSTPFKGGVLVPAPDLIVGQTVDPFGEAFFGGLWPPGIPSGFSVHFQYWIVDAAGPAGFAASNAVSGTTP
jgi:hypothetical protein